MRSARCWLFILFLGCTFAAGPVPSPTCPPGVSNCVPPSPSSASISGEYPIEVDASLGKDWKKGPFGAPTNYVVSLASDKTPVTCTEPASITTDEHGLVTSCTSTPPSPAAGFYSYPSNLLVTNEGLVGSVQNNTEPPLPANATFDVRVPPRKRKPLALDTCYKRCLGAWRDQWRCKRDCY